jgi:double-stranded uracil-DNA glycosylase
MRSAEERTSWLRHAFGFAMNSSGFAPVADPDARILILGTLPGAVSLETGQYYAQPRNAFWTIMGEVCGAGTSLPYEERLERLLRRRIAIWDVCASARRPGSLDSGIGRARSGRTTFAGFSRRIQTFD